MKFKEGDIVKLNPEKREDGFVAGVMYEASRIFKITSFHGVFVEIKDLEHLDLGGYILREEEILKADG